MSQASKHYEVSYQDVLQSPTTNYQVVEFLGSGSFGQVFKCLDTNSGQAVAVKLEKHTSNVEDKYESNLLRRLIGQNTDKYNLMKNFERFHYKQHVCIVSEMLQQTLFQFIEKNEFAPLPFSAVRPIVQQILVGLGKLKELGIIHSDLKPENIMLVDMENQPYKIKIIDFGSAVYVKDVGRDVYVQSRYYRAPEVLLGLPVCEAIDMWSLGCIAAELLMGHPLYPGACSYDQIRYIVNTRGLPRKDMLRNASKRNEFFSCDIDGVWSLKGIEQYEAETGVAVKGPRNPKFTPLDSLNTITIRRALKGRELAAERKDRTVFIHLLKWMLDLNQNCRITPKEALQHPFLCLDHLQEYDKCANVQESRNMMDICYGSNPCDTAPPCTS